MTDASDRPEPFEVKLEQDGERLVVVASGELDLATADHLRATVQQQFQSGFRDVVADLRQLSFIDSSGVRVLWEVHRSAEDEGRRLSVVPGSGEVRRALQLTGFLDRLNVTD